MGNLGCKHMNSEKSMLIKTKTKQMVEALAINLGGRMPPAPPPFHVSHPFHLGQLSMKA